jgi:hypothetical protein
VVFTFVDDVAQWFSRQLRKRRPAEPPGEAVPAK